MRGLMEALNRFEAAQEDVKRLDAYLGSEEWRQDLADDEKGLLPHGLKRGVLSEDGIWNLLEDYRSLAIRMKTLSDEMMKTLSDELLNENNK